MIKTIITKVKRIENEEIIMVMTKTKIIITVIIKELHKGFWDCCLGQGILFKSA